MDTKQKVLGAFEKLQIPYEITEHPAVYTIEEMEAEGICDLGEVCKNLFLRDAKGSRHILLVVDKDKRVDLHKIREQLGTTRLSFASEERLQKYLKLTRGSVTPLSIINDPERLVEVAVDRDLVGKARLGFHPNVNTATVWISFDSLMKFVKACGHSVTYVKI